MNHFKPRKIGCFFQEKGFTLVEVLVAAAIFVVVISTAMLTFSVNANLRSQSQAISEASLNARYAVESMAREVRLAAGYRIVDSTHLLITSHDESGQLVSREYFLQPYSKTNSNGAIFVSVNGGSAQPLTTPEVNITTVGNGSLFEDNNSVASGVLQSFLKIQFRVEAHLGAKTLERFTQTISTTVASRSYSSGFTETIPGELR